jgi:HK97 family phage major capsid protein
MSGFSVASNDHLIRSNLWSSQIKEVLEDELFAMKYVDMLTDFPDGETFNIPSIGQAEVADYVENAAVTYTGMDTGNFTFTITDYKSSATYITNKMKQDSFYMDRLVSSFVPKMNRALMKTLEVAALGVGPAGQTSADNNEINDAYHRLPGGGTSETVVPEDFAKALYALQKANVPMTNLVAIVDPSVEYSFNTMTNLVNSTNNPRWEGIVSDGFSTGMKFVKNIYGFDVYTSQNLTVNSASETLDSIAVAAGVNNLFFSATPDVLPFVGSLRQPPKVDSEYNKDLQRDEYVTTMRFGMKLFRPENLVIVVSDTDAVY